jgi:1-acyl-sn-glycerol-3-phosphate acyltransferase
VGFHPEGTRNKSGDPYRLLPPRAATKRVLHTARRSGAMLVPIFMNGLDGGMHRALWKNWLRSGRINVMIGEPIDARALVGRCQSDGSDPVAHVMDTLHSLAAEERSLREAQPSSPAT